MPAAIPVQRAATESRSLLLSPSAPESTVPVAHLVWPSAFEVIGPFAFLLIAGTLLLEVPVLKGAE